MDSLFKQKLLGLRHPPIPTSFAEALLTDTSWFHQKKELENAAPSFKHPDPGFTEKTHIIESLERFAHEKAEELKTSILAVDGGEVHVKTSSTWSRPLLAASKAELFEHLSLGPRLLELLLAGKEPGKVKVLFVAEKFRKWDEVVPELKESGLINELLAGFPLKTAELFERMILAMKLSPAEVCLYPVENDTQDLTREVLSLLAYLRPEVIVTLGAKSTNSVLSGQDRLAKVHGQFFTRSIEGVGSFQVVPLFHPSIIETNLNMKKTAWVDMQKIMKYLKKVP
ncbi:MAG TPA: hypothetical protein VNJ01_17235 [Bacteriovoracaceae bacterium]|nr:hypothetical protein [Bacteriovoracaceae bacterium]